MIRFQLQCSDGHQFESWFQSSAAFDTLKAAGHVTCVTCGTSDVSKAIMAPAVQTTDAATAPKRRDPVEKLREHVESTADYVGTSFATEARKIHLGDAPERPIYGEAKPQDAKKLVEDGVPVLPLPFIPRKRSN